jgi:hypothetical protein
MNKENNINLASVYGEYNVEVLKSGGKDSYFPFGTGLRKNIIVDQFFGQILSGYSGSTQAFIQTCIANTGSTPATRYDTPTTFGIPNDITHASTVFNTGVITAENRIFLNRDFIFDTVTSPKTYREAMVGCFGLTGSAYLSGPTGIENITTSHFVFPSDVTINAGERLKVNYTLNLVIDYLASNVPVAINGNGYNFGGNIRLTSSSTGIFGLLDGTSTQINTDTYSANTNSLVYSRLFAVNSNVGAWGTPLIANTQNTFNGLFGIKANRYRNVGFYNSTYSPTRVYPFGFTGYIRQGPTGILSTSNFQLTDNGASIDVGYYFAASGAVRNVSGIYLTAWYDNAFVFPQFAQNSAIYLAFNTGQIIAANDAVSMKLRWSFNRV